MVNDEDIEQQLRIEVIQQRKQNHVNIFFFFSSRRRHTRCREVSWARRCVQETGINAEYMGCPQPPKVNNQNNIIFLAFNIEHQNHLKHHSSYFVSLQKRISPSNQISYTHIDFQCNNSQKFSTKHFSYPLQYLSLIHI
eukprot:TRINITY_DN26399_c0_g1_i1.p1 TRINITY_DN26399_c0_g1~~TRINITY_DN26399_c0_g1_i1.p1  ORF type:complete len:139 (+),score=21.51 TRINITY_DN26399_c0_g1_i1:2-418(+)